MATRDDPYLAEIVLLVEERGVLYARQCAEAGDRERLGIITDRLDTLYRRRNVWRIGGDPATVDRPLPALLKDMRAGGNHWKARGNR